MKHRTTTPPASIQPEPLAPICWERDSAPACLRVEVCAGEIYLLPYAHFLFGHFTSDAGDVGDATAAFSSGRAQREILRLSFTTHEVEIGGCGLRELYLGIQEMCVKWVRPVPVRYSPIAGAEGGGIFSIKITKLDGNTT